ncbi:hypothetical protein [Methanogenium cariaci]|uniref:hypothetical protein n=1 Tax=Methanogenium cariaci TaxID=2197 RepID=UPI000780E75B|nr:hypothetical protein [Methanogenium cariaci]
MITERGIEYPACLGSVGGEKSRVIGEIFADYRRRLNAEDAVDSSSICSAAADALSRSPPIRFSGCIYGIHATLPEAERFLRQLTETGGEWMVFTPTGANPAIFGPDACSSAETGDGGGVALFRNNRTQAPPVPLSCGTFPDRRTEFRAVAQQISDLIHTGTPPPGDIAVALPDIRAEEGRLSAIFADFGIPAATSATLPLAQEPLIQALLLPLRVVADNYERRTIVALFSQPFFQFKDANEESVSGSDINRCACQAGIREGAAAGGKDSAT